MVDKRDICILVWPDTVRALQNKSFEYRAWAGLSIIRDVLERAGEQVGYCDADGASNRIVLASITGARHWYSLVDEWVRAKPQNATLIIGGAAVLNIRPFLPLSDAIFVLGRGEDVILDVIKAARQGERVDSTSVIYSDAFAVNHTYRLHQGASAYPHRVRLENGKYWTEQSIGCHYRCLFCNYTWTRTAWQEAKEYGPQISDRGVVIAGASNLEEHNLRELVTNWRAGGTKGIGGMVNSAIDGQSQRIRLAVKKPVNRQDVEDAAALCPKRIVLSLMTVIGFPTETAEDRVEAIEDLKRGLKKRNQGIRWAVEISPNAFRPMPATPLALWSTQVDNWTKRLLREWGGWTAGHKYRLWSSPSENVGIKMAWSAGAACTLLEEMIVLRGTEDDFDNLAKLAGSRLYWGASAAKKEATLSHYFDLDRLTGEYTPETYPARYLEGNTPNEVIWRAGAIALAKLKGLPPPRPGALDIPSHKDEQG